MSSFSFSRGGSYADSCISSQIFILKDPLFSSHSLPDLCSYLCGNNCQAGIFIEFFFKSLILIPIIKSSASLMLAFPPQECASLNLLLLQDSGATINLLPASLLSSTASSSTDNNPIKQSKVSSHWVVKSQQKVIQFTTGLHSLWIWPTVSWNQNQNFIYRKAKG